MSVVGDQIRMTVLLDRLRREGGEIMGLYFSGVFTPEPEVKEVNKFPDNCSVCEESVITLNNYSRCKLNGGCYIPAVVEEQRPDSCPLRLKEELNK